MMSPEMKWTILKEYRGIPVSVISSNRKTDLVQKAMKKAKMSSPSEEKMSQSPQEKTSLKLSLGGRRYAELTEWNGTKRVDLRFWENDKVPTKVGVSLSLPQWKVLCSATQVVDDLISRVKDREPVDWKYHLGEDIYVIIKAPHLTIHVRKCFVPNGEWTLHPTKTGITLTPYEWEELKKIISVFEDREPKLKKMDNKVTGEN